MSTTNKIQFNLEEAVVKDLQFEPVPALHNLVIGGIEKVSLKEVDIPLTDEAGNVNTNEYAGKKVTSIEILFVTTPNPKTNERRKVMKVIESMPYTLKKDGSEILAEQVSKNVLNMFQRLKHIHDAYTGLPDFSPITKINDIDPFASVDKRIDSFKTFFTTFATSFNEGKNKKPFYLNPAGTPIAMWCKVVPDFYSKAWFGFPSFVGTGFIERVIVDKVSGKAFAPNIRVNANESLVLAPAKKGKKEAPVDNGDNPELEGGMASVLSDLYGSKQ